MPFVKVADVPGGDTVTQFICEDGYRVPVFVEKEKELQAMVDNIANIPCRDDDILLNSYAKTGTNWLFEMLSMILNGKAEIISHTKGAQMLEARPAETVESQPSPRMLNTHVKVKYIPKDAQQRKVKCILLARNPKDVVVSFYHHTLAFNLYRYKGKFGNYLQMFMRGEVDYGAYAEYMYEWQQYIRAHPDWPIHIMYYEDLKEDCVGELRRLCEYLELDVSLDLLADVAAASTIDNLKKNKEKKLDEQLLKRFKSISNIGVHVLYRKGQIGDWKNWFTVSQNEAFDDWWAAETRDLDMFTFRYAPSREQTADSAISS